MMGVREPIGCGNCLFILIGLGMIWITIGFIVAAIF